MKIAERLANGIKANGDFDNSMVNGFHAGMVMAFATTYAPRGWFTANGSAVSRTTYKDLFDAIGTTYGAGDGSTTFNLPDLRGEFIRGVDAGRGVDSGRVTGSRQGDAIRNITAGIGLHSSERGSSFWHLEGAFTGNLVSQFLVGTSVGTEAPSYGGLTFNAARVVPTAAENRPRNVALLYCIKY